MKNKDELEDKLIFSNQSLGSYGLWEKLSEIENKNSIISIDIRNNPINDEAARDLSDFENIQILNIGNTLFTKLDFLESFSNLRILVANDLSDLGDISVLKNLPNLEELYVSETSIKDLSSLINLKKLRILDLSGTPVSDITSLSGLSSLKELYLNGTKISTELQLQPICELNLTVLGLNESLDTDLRRLPSLN